MLYSLLPLEILQIIYRYLHNLKPIHNELLSNCVRRYYEVLSPIGSQFQRIYEYEAVIHKTIHPLYSNTKFWNECGWCSVKCGSLNWPHTCNFCLTCNADPDYCSCLP